MANDLGMRPIRHSLQHPAATALLALLAVVSLLSLPTSPLQPRSLIGGLLPSQSSMRVSPDITYWYLGATNEGWTLISSSGESADAMSRAIAADAHRVYIVRRARGIRGRGIYDPAVVTRFDTIDAASAAGKVASAEQIQGILLFLKSVPDFEPFAEGSAEFKPGSASVKVWTVQWPAVAHNTLAAFIWLALPISLGWIPRVVRERRAARRQRAGLCPCCAYDRRSTPAEAPCPECGQTPGASTKPA